jgi:hypothetical protein
MKGKSLLAVFVLLLISSILFKGYAQPTEEEISTAFQDAVNAVLYPEEIGPVPDLFAYEIESKILPKAPEIIAETVSLLYERTGEDVGVVHVFAVLPPKVEEALLPKKEEIKTKSAEILESQALENQTKEE